MSVEVIRVVHVPACRHCGRPHGDRKIYEPSPHPTEYDPSRTPGKEFAFCTDGNHAAWVAG